MPYVGKEPVRGQNRELDDISGSFNGGNTAFTMQVGGVNTAAGSANQVFISLGGVMQNPGTDFTVASSTITFTTPPANGLDFWGLIQGDAVDINTPADGSVTEAKLNANAPTNDHVLTADATTSGGFKWAAVSGTTINTNADNRVITGSGTANTLNGEANLTYNGSDLALSRADNAAGGISVTNTNDAQASGIAQLALSGGDNSYANISLEAGGNNHHIKNDNSGNLYILDGATNRLQIDSSGHVKVSDGDLVIGTAGHGIDFSAQTATSATGATTGGELLDHYEEGTFTPVAAQGTFTVTQAHYTRIGRAVTYQIYGSFSSNSSGSPQSLTNFPFAMVAGTYYSAAVNSNTGSSSHPVAQLDASDGHMYFKDTSNNAFNGGDMSGHFIVLSGICHTT